MADSDTSLVSAPTLKSHLPGVEPEQRLNDWGRSERIEGVFDATVVEFFYRYWFRAGVEGMENVPATGGALLVSNHSGALPPDAAMIGKAIREEHPHPRPLNITIEHFFKGYPGLSTLLPKIGCVAAHPANVHRLLYDEEQLVLVFPEGRRGAGSSSRTAIACAASVAADLSRRPCAPAPGSCRCAWWEPKRPRRCSPSSACSSA